MTVVKKLVCESTTRARHGAQPGTPGRRGEFRTLPITVTRRAGALARERWGFVVAPCSSRGSGEMGVPPARTHPQRVSHGASFLAPGSLARRRLARTGNSPSSSAAGLVTNTEHPRQ